MARISCSFFRFVLMLALLCVGLAPAARAGNFVIVSNGVPQCTIVVPVTNASDDSWFGACELTNHIFQITGAMVPVALETSVVNGAMIVVGKSKNRLVQLDPSSNLYYSNFQGQEYQIWFTNGSVSLYGAENAGGPTPTPTWPDLNWVPDTEYDDSGFHGTLYAVYDFLEKYCGVHWYQPGPYGMTCPKTNTLVVTAENLRRAPAMTYRSAPGFDNLATQMATPPSEWGTLSNTDTRKWALRNKCGGLHFSTSHSLTHYHEYFTNIEWFARTTNNVDLGNKPCFSSTGFTAQVIADCQLYFDTGQNPHQMQIVEGCPSMTPDDGWGYCKCTNCAPVDWANNQGWMSCGEVSSTFWKFVKNVADAIAISHPGKRICSLAYQSYYNCPTNVIVPTNVVVGPCPFYNRQWAYGIEKDPYYANEIAQITNWATHFHGELNGMWTYPCYPEQGPELAGYNCFPGFFAHRHAWELLYFYTNGVMGNNNCGGGEFVDSYVIAKYQDDPTQNVDVLLGTMFTNYYGPAATPMLNLYREAEDAYSYASNYPGTNFSTAESICWTYVGSSNRMAQWKSYVDQATAAALSQTTYATRVAIFTNSMWRYMMDGSRRYQLNVGKDSEAQWYSANVVPPVTSYLSTVGYAGSFTNVNWNSVKPQWAERDTYGYPVEKKAEVRVVHDGTYVYIRVIQDVAGQYLTGGSIDWSDSWRFFFSSSRASYGFRQAFDGKGAIESGSIPAENSIGGGQWTMKVSVPISNIIGHAWTAGESVYMNFVREGTWGNEWPQYSPQYVGGWPIGQNPAKYGQFVLAGLRTPTTLYVNATNLNPVAPYESWATAATSIQDAVEVALTDDTILVAPGLYGGNVRSADSTNRVHAVMPVNIVALSSNNPTATIINGSGTHRGVWMEAGGMLKGFTLTNCVTDSGAGFLGNANIENCIVANNVATNGHGGGIIDGNGVIRNCLVFNNVCTNSSNSRDGGGLYVGGLGAVGCVIENCTVVNNYAGRDGGGIFMDNRATTNVTLNCIVYGNKGTPATMLDIEYGKGSSPVSMTYSCAPNLTAGASGNITNNPLFMAGSYQLASNSPCVNSGLNSAWMGGGIDLAGNARLQNTTVDMGAYESGSAALPPLVISIPIAGGVDDVEENLTNGVISTNSSDIELTYDGTTPQKVGLRFVNVPIPQGATIVSAAIQFMADETNDVATALTIKAQKTGNAPAFSTNSGNVSARTLTTASVNWNPPGWYVLQEAAAAQRTPELASVVQEVVSQGSWASNNAMVFVISGTGTRTAESQDFMTNGITPPTLVVEWNMTGGGTTDTDTDGMPDTWEQTYFGGTSSTNGGAMQDADGDGLPNQYEYIAGTDPTNWGSQFEVMNTTNSSTPWVIRWNSASNRTYGVFHRTNLTGGVWATLTNGMPTAYPGQNVYTDYLHTSGPGGYYKIKVTAP